MSRIQGAHFIIRNVFVHDRPTVSANVVLKNVFNGRVEAKVSNGNIGILLWSTANSTVAQSEISNFDFRGIDLTGASFNVIEANEIRDVASPIDAFESSHNMFLRNVIEGRQGTAAAGTVLSTNSSFNVFQGNTIRGGHFGISMGLDSNFNVVRGNLIQSVERSGVTVGRGSRGNIIEENIIVDSGRGVLINQAMETIVRSNLISATSRAGAESITGKGVWVIDSWRNWITGNTILAPVGISICRSPQTFIPPPPNDLKGSERRIEHFYV